MILEVLILFSASVNFVSSANILGIFPFTAKSHFTVFEPLLLELHHRGHNLTVLSHFHMNLPNENYTHINLAGTIRSLHGNLSLSNLNNAPLSLYANLKQLYEDIDVYEGVLNSSRVQNFLKSNSHFDLIITEIFNTDLFLGFVHRFKAPFIAMSACPLMPWANDRFSNPDNPSYIPVVFTPYSDQMDFVHRTINSFYLLASKMYYNLVIDAKSEQIARKYFGNVPLLSSIAKNVSLILVNTHFTVHKSAPLSSKVIQVGGIHIKNETELNGDLRAFIEGARHGVILFSMGSMFRSCSLPKGVRTAFLNAFEKLPQRVIWTWDSEPLHTKRQNIKFMKWIPQRDILAHKNVKLFIYHGGLLGTTEAVYCGVPILGIPLFGDMPRNMAAVAAAGAGISLPFREITEDSVYSAITKIIKNSNYKTNAMKLSKEFRDRPMSPLDTAVYWTEYVIRHKGAHQLDSAAKHLSWIQLHLIDVTFVSLVFILVTTLLISKLSFISWKLVAEKIRTSKIKHS